MLGIGFIIASSAVAQRQCASVSYNDLQKSIDPSFESRTSAIENFIRNQVQISARETGEVTTVIRIPVVVHVIYKNAGQNISGCPDQKPD